MTSPTLEQAARAFIADFDCLTDAQLRHAAAGSPGLVTINVAPEVATAALRFRAALDASPTAIETRARTALAFIAAYNAALDDDDISPNGDDFNDLCDGLTTILTGGQTPKITVTADDR